MKLESPSQSSSARLARLIESGRCPPSDAPEYAHELKRVAQKVASVQVVKRQSRVLKALADETRLRILRLLEVREMCVCEIMIAFDLTQPTASHHLGILEEAGFVERRKEGKWVFYSVADPKLVENMRKLSIL